MKKTVFFPVILLLLFVSSLHAGSNDGEIGKILFSAESLFKAMKEKNYPKIWTFLTVKSKKTIVDDVLKAEERIGRKYTREDIGKDFIAGNQLSRSYWNSYLVEFNPDWVLEKSRWEIGQIEKNQAEVIIRYNKSDGSVVLKMSKEEGQWMVGLRETFKSSGG
jgi:hypothetical protein